MGQSQIIRLPKKYGELFSTLDNAEAGKLIKELFGYNVGVEGITRVYRDMMKVDLENMESSAINGKKGGRPKNEKPQVKTPGYGKEKPQDSENDNLKEEKIREDNINKKENKEQKENEFEKYISNEENVSITFYIIKYFLSLGWKPAEDETVETLRNWITEVMKENGIDTGDKMKSSIDKWYEYWKTQKKPKNIKSTFRNTIKFSK